MNWQKNFTFLAGIAAAFAIMAYFVVPYFASKAGQGNFLIQYLLFAFAYTAIVWYFIFQGKFSIGFITALTIIFIVGDIAIPPLLVTKTGPIQNLPGQAAFSSDLFIYDLLPSSLQKTIPYFATYVLIPTLLIFLASLIVGQKQALERVA